MAYQVWTKTDNSTGKSIITGFILGPQQHGSKPAPEGFAPDNKLEWVKDDTGWHRDKQEADTVRENLR